MSDASALSAALAGHYEVIRELGQGGMATVYLARDVRHDREVAIKVLHPDLGAALGGDRFLAEIKTTAKLQHPHILTLIDSGSAGGLLYYVMPVVSGESLRDRLDRERQLPITEAVRIAREVAGALDYAHRHDVIHRDIKPENILLHDGSAIVADFGIALAVQSAGGPRMTQTGLSLGTPQYMSPEQAMGERHIDARSDIYSLGAVTYEMLTGDPPFTGSSVQAIVAKVMTERPTSPRVMRDTVPPYLEAAVMTALAKLPADRFATGAEFVAALEGRGAATTVPSQVMAPSRSPDDHRRKLLLAAGVAAAACAIGFAAGWSSHHSAGSHPRFFQKTFDENVISNARFAPDHKTLLYSTMSSRSDVRVMIIRPDSPQPQPLGLDHTALLSVSSQGELAVLTHPVNRAFQYYEGTLARVPLEGGAPRQLVDSVADADWSPDGAQLAIVRVVGGKDRLEYPIGTVLYETPGWISNIRFAPDGKSIAFANHPLIRDNRGTIDVVDLHRGHSAWTRQEFGGTEGLAWSPDGKEVFFSSSTTTHQMVVFGVTRGGALREALNAPGSQTIVDIAADGRWLLTHDVRSDRVQLHSPSDSVAHTAGWLDFGWKIALSNDGSQLALSDASMESGQYYSVLLRSDTGGRTARLGDGWPEQFSRDGKWVLSVVPSTPARLVEYPTGAGSERTIPTPEFQAIRQAEWMPDEQSVVVCGTGTAKATRCVLEALDGKTIRALPEALPEGLVDHVIAPDGASMLAMRNGSFVAVSLADGSIRAVPHVDRIQRLVRWSPDSRGLWIVGKGTTDLERLDLSSGNLTAVLPNITAPFRPSDAVSALLVADDPRTSAAILEFSSSELFVVEGAR